METPMPEEADINRAMEVFVKGFAFTRCFTYPSAAERMGRIWVVRDATRKRHGDYRREEWVAFGIEPNEVDAAARKGTRGRFCICAIHATDESDAALRAGYKVMGYRLNASEALMIHRLARIPKFRVPFPIERVTTPDLAERVAKAAGRRQILPEHLAGDRPLRLYTALDGNKPIGWLRSITIDNSTWVSNVHVDPNYRRRGIGKSLLAKMLRDDRKFGSHLSALLASHAGELLYDHVGFEKLGTLLVFTPKR